MEQRVAQAGTDAIDRILELMNGYNGAKRIGRTPFIWTMGKETCGYCEERETQTYCVMCGIPWCASCKQTFHAEYHEGVTVKAHG